MNKAIYELIISIEVYSFFNYTQDYVFMRDSLDKIDDTTMRSLDASSFFKAHEKFIYSRICSSFEEKYGFSPTGIALGKDGIRINKPNGEQIRALFKKIDLNNCKIDLDDIIMNRMMHGNLKTLYECDKKRKDMEDYDSFFAGLDDSLLERIEIDAYDANDVVLVWNFIKSSKRKYPLMRFLLDSPKDNDFSEKWDLFNETIPSKEVIYQERPVLSRETEHVYRYPYNDN